MKSQRQSSEFYYFHTKELQELNELLECSWEEIVAAILPNEQLPMIQREWPSVQERALKEVC